MTANILIVDDQASMLKLEKQLLEDQGYNVTWAFDAAQALDLLKEDAKKFDLIISDVNMPNMDGFQLLKKIKTDYPNQRVVLMTGTSENVAEVVSKEYKADGLITKPFQLEDALKTIEGALNNNQ